jgi:hypothetical protein
MNIHLFVIVSTILFWLLLKNYKSHIQSSQNKSNFIYVLFVPILLYTLYMNTNININECHISTQSSELAPFPDSISLSN